MGGGLIVGTAPVAHAAPDPIALYDSIGTVPGNVASVGFEATSTSEIGDRVQIGPGPRQLSSVTVLMSSWACQIGGWTGPTPCFTNPGATFTHPLTLTLYADNGTATPGGVLATTTVDATIPYRPSADPVNCSGGRWFNGTTCYNGFASPVTFDFAPGTVLPSRLIWTISYNTSNHGYHPIGAAACGSNCPYDSLNVGAATLTPSPTHGTDVDPAGIFWNTSYAGFYCDGGVGGAGTLRLDDSCWTNNRPMATITTVPLSQADSTVVVRAATPTWGFFTENTVGGQTGSFGVGPATPPGGTGSAQIGLTASNQGMALGTVDFAGTPLANLTRLGYSSYQTGTPQAVSLQFEINYHGPGDVAYAGRLVYEPYLTDTVSPNVWQSWNALNGKWWASKTGTPGSGGLCGQGSPCTWAQVMTNWPDATIRGMLLFKAGSGWTSFSGAVDDLSVGVTDGLGNITNTTFDFEDTPQCTTVCYVDAATGNDLNGGTTAVDAKRTIQAGVDQVSPGGTVSVAAGNYSNATPVLVGKSVSIIGPNVAHSPGVPGSPRLAEATVSTTGATESIRVTSPDVVVDGFQFSCSADCIVVDSTVGNVVMRDNDVTVDAGAAIVLSTSWTGGAVSIDHNELNGVSESVVAVANGSADLSRVAINRNGIVGAGVRNDLSLQVIDASCNWWGSADGAGATQNVGNVDASKPLGDSDLTGACVEPSQHVDPPPTPSHLADFVPVTPSRIFDTRPQSPPSMRVVDQVTVGGANVLEVKVTDLGDLVPATGVGAVSLNVTAVDPSGPGFVTVYPCGEMPLASNVNYRAGQTVPNAVIAPVSATGTVCFYSLAPTHLVVDINGWFRAGGGYTPVGPRRVLDTRPGQSPVSLRQVPTSKLVAGSELQVQLSDLGSYVPASGVAAVSLNVTVVDAEQRGFLSVYPCGGPRPEVSSVNYEAGDTIANEVIAALSADGNVCFFASATVDLVVDVNGWLASVSDFHRSGPSRILDTRPGQSANALLQVAPVPLQPNNVVEVNIADLGGAVPSTGVSAVSLNVTATNITQPGFVTVYPCGQLPLASSVNYAVPELSTANAVLVPVSAAGTVCFYGMSAVDLVVDINGWFAAS